MRKSSYTNEQIAFVVKQAETGTSVAEVLRSIGISEQTSRIGIRALSHKRL